MKQTAVEWLFEQVCNLDWKNLIGDKKQEIFEQAKAIEKEQVTTFAKLWEEKLLDGRTDSVDDLYNDTYGN
jgi:hypothetical protein